MDTVKRVVGAIFDFLQSVVVIMAIMVMIYLFVISPQEINGQSMFPNFKNGEYILTNKVIYKIREPKRGDVVVFKSPKNKEIDYIKRIIALPGETVRLENNTFYVNGQAVIEPYIPPGTFVFGGGFLQEGQEATVPQGTYFVVGDNRPHSADSREFGPVPIEDFIGMAFLRYWPFEEFTILEHPMYDIQ